MISLHSLRTDSSNNSQFPNKKELEKAPSIQTLPLEIFEKIFSNLNNAELQQANLVNKDWSHASIHTAKKEISLVKAFSTFLGKNLPVKSYKKQRKRLFAIKKKNEISDDTLKNIKSSIYSLKETILNILKKVTSRRLNKLEKLAEDQTKPKFFEDLFKLAKIYKQIDAANKIPDEPYISMTLSDICEYLLQNNFIDKALEIARTIPNEPFISMALEDICEYLLENNFTDKALEIAYTIPDEASESAALKDICKYLLENNFTDKALEIALTITDETYRSIAFDRIKAK